MEWKSIWNWMAEQTKRNFERYDWFFASVEKRAVVYSSVCSFTMWPRFPAKSLSSPNSVREKWMCALSVRACGPVSKVQFTRVTFPVFFACFLKVEFLVGDCAWVSVWEYNVCTLILINCFDATVEIWTMKFDAIKAYHLIRNGITHNNTFTSNWFVSGLVIVYNTCHVFLSLSRTSHEKSRWLFNNTHNCLSKQ